MNSFAVSEAQRDGLAIALQGVVPLFFKVNDSTNPESPASIEEAVERVMKTAEIMETLLKLTSEIDFSKTPLSDDDARRLFAAFKSAMLGASNGGGAVVGALSSKQRVAINRVVTQAVRSKMMTDMPAAGVELLIEQRLKDDAKMERFLDAIKGIELASMSEGEERVVHAAVQSLVLDKDNDQDEVF